MNENGRVLSNSALLIMGLRKTLTLLDYGVFCRTLGPLIRAKIPLLEALETVEAHVRRPSLRRFIAHMNGCIRQGLTLIQTMDSYDKPIHPVMKARIAVAEQTGTLGEAVDSLQRYFEHLYVLHKNIRHIMAYPVFVFCIVIGMIVGVGYGLVPAFEGVWETPPDSYAFQSLLGLSWLLQNHGMSLAIGVGGVPILCIFLFRFSFMRDFIYRYPCLFPLWGHVMLYQWRARMLRMLSELVAARIPLSSALPWVLDATGDKGSQWVQALHDGHLLSHILDDTGRLTPSMIHICRIAEQTGEMRRLLPEIATIAETDLSDMTASLMRMMGPTLTLCMGGMIIWVVMGMLFPLYDQLTLMVHHG
jgi:general secretion pathway protein F